MAIIDVHTHLDDSRYESADIAAATLDQQLDSADVEKAIVLHLAIQPWTLKEFAGAISKHDRLVPFANIDPGQPNAEDILLSAIKDLGFAGLKLHPRLQGVVPNSKATISLVKYAGDIGVPVLIDLFPDGGWLMLGRNILEYVELCEKAPKTRIIVAHMGGHRVLDLMMVCKRIPNMYLDCSLSVMYYRGSHVEQDLIYAMKNLKFEKIFYGSDYPDRPIADTLRGSVEVFEKYGMTAWQIDKILYKNAQTFFEW